MTKEGFTAEKADALSDKAFLRGLWTSVISIIVCLALLCSMTYAWFTSEVKSDTNSLISGSFALSMQVTDSYGNVIPLTRDNPMRPSERTATLPTAGDYTVTLTLDPNSEAKGYCIVTCGEFGATVYPKLTDVIVGDSTHSPGGHEKNSPFVFKVVVTSSDVMLRLEPCYGSPSVTHILKDTSIHQDAFEIQH